MCGTGAGGKSSSRDLCRVDGGTGGKTGIQTRLFRPAKHRDTGGLSEFPPRGDIPRTLDAVPRDPDDNAVLESALEGNAKYVVTGDLDLLELKNFRGIEIVRASEFLNIVAKQS